jgi:type I restriction enzyme S subunit
MLSGGTPSKAQPDYWGGDIPWVSAKDMKERRLRDAEDHITPTGLANGSKLAPASATLVLTRGMTLLTDVPICALDRDVAFNQDVKAIVPRDEIDPLYLIYALRAAKPELLSMVELAGHGTGRLPTDRLKALEIPLPDKCEQRAIAHILGTLDDKIEINRRMNETLEAMAQAIFQSWFVDFGPVRLKAEGRDPDLPREIADLFPDCFKDSELGQIPEGWTIHTLYDCADYINGATFRNKHFSPDRTGLPVIKIGELKDGVTAQTKFTEHNFDERYRISDGEILFSWSGSPDTSIDIFLWADGEGWLNQHIFKIQLKHPSERSFVYNLLRFLKPVFIEIARNKQTTGLGHVTATDLKRLKTVKPPEIVLLSFNQLAEPLFEKTFANLQESRTLAAIRDALLPKLISGERRLKDANQFVAEGRL